MEEFDFFANIEEELTAFLNTNVEEKAATQEHEENLDYDIERTIEALINMDDDDETILIIKGEDEPKPEANARDLEEKFDPHIEEEIQAFLNTDITLSPDGEKFFDPEADLLELEKLLRMSKTTTPTFATKDDETKKEEYTTIFTPQKKPTCPDNPLFTNVASSFVTKTRILKIDEENLQRILDADPFWINSSPVLTSSSIATSARNLFSTNLFRIKTPPANPKCGKGSFISKKEHVFDPGGRIINFTLPRSAKKITRADDGSWKSFKEKEVTRPP